MPIKIFVKYSSPESEVLEIGFYRGETLLHNVFYDIEGLNEDELLELKKEALAKFCACFPDISKKEVMKGFSTVDPLMQKLYNETFNPRGAGRKMGKKIKPPTVMFARRVTPDQAKKLDKYLKKLKSEGSEGYEGY